MKKNKNFFATLIFCLMLGVGSASFANLYAFNIFGFEINIGGPTSETGGWQPETIVCYHTNNIGQQYRGTKVVCSDGTLKSCTATACHNLVPVGK